MCLLLPSAQLISPSATTFGRQPPLSAALTLRTQPNLYASRLCSLFPEPLIPALASATASLRWIRAKGVEAVHNVLTAAMDHALKMELIGRNPVTLVTPPKSPKKRAFVPEVSQVHAFLAEAERSEHLLWPAVHVAAYTGVRRGEISGLEWGNVDLDDACLSVVQSLVVTAHGVKMEPPKTECGEREIELDAETVGVLRDHRARQLDLATTLGVDPPQIVFPESLSTIFLGLARRRQARPFAGLELPFAAASRVGGLPFPAWRKTAPPPIALEAPVDQFVAFRTTTSTERCSSPCQRAS